MRCGTVTVPTDYQHPKGSSIPVAVTEAPAQDPSDQLGTLVMNPGGPGESGVQIQPVLLQKLPTDIREHFDIVSFDPRGTGASDPLRCGTSPSAAVSVGVLPTMAGQPLPAPRCSPRWPGTARHSAGTTVPFMTTINTARDMDRIRQALGLSTISYYGLSYGTVLGADYADLFPHRVATMVLDGAVDVNATLTHKPKRRHRRQNSRSSTSSRRVSSRPRAHSGRSPKLLHQAGRLTDRPSTPGPGRRRQRPGDRRGPGHGHPVRISVPRPPRRTTRP